MDQPDKPMTDLFDTGPPPHLESGWYSRWNNRNNQQP
jgi:hypothetical protein